MGLYSASDGGGDPDAEETERLRIQEEPGKGPPHPAEEPIKCLPAGQDLQLQPTTVIPAADWLLDNQMSSRTVRQTCLLSSGDRYCNYLTEQQGGANISTFKQYAGLSNQQVEPSADNQKSSSCSDWTLFNPLSTGLNVHKSCYSELIQSLSIKQYIICFTRT